MLLFKNQLNDKLLTSEESLMKRDRRNYHFDYKQTFEHDEELYLNKYNINYDLNRVNA